VIQIQIPCMFFTLGTVQACSTRSLHRNRRSQNQMSARVLPCLRAPYPYLRVPILRAGLTLACSCLAYAACVLFARVCHVIFWATHLPTTCACPTLLIVLSMYVMSTLFGGCYYCMCGNTLTIPHTLSLSLFCPTLNVCPMTRLTRGGVLPSVRVMCISACMCMCA